MAVRKALQPFELLAIFLAVPSLMLGAVVLAVEMWPLPGPGENSMAVVIPCGLGSVALFVLFLIVAALARLRWRWFVGIAGVWAAMCVALYVSEQSAAARMSDPQPLHISIRRVDTLDSSLMQPVFFVRDDAQRNVLMASGRFGADPEHTLIVEEAGLACISERIGRLRNPSNAEDERVIEIEVIRSGSVMWATVVRSEVLAFLDSVGECVDVRVRERISELRVGIERSMPRETDKK